MSSHLKSAGTTSRLLLAAESVLSGSDAYVEIVSQIEQDHRKAAWEALGGIGEPDSSKGTDPHAQLRSQCLDAISEECGKLKSFLDACSTIEEISPRSRDMVISVGEKLSALIFSAVLKSHGIPSAYVNLERLVDRHFAENEVGQAFYDYLASRLGEVLSAVCWDDAAVDKAVGSGRTRGVEGWVVPVVTGGLWRGFGAEAEADGRYFYHWGSLVLDLLLGRWID